MSWLQLFERNYGSWTPDGRDPNGSPWTLQFGDGLDVNGGNLYSVQMFRNAELGYMGMQFSQPMKAAQVPVGQGWCSMQTFAPTLLEIRCGEHPEIRQALGLGANDPGLLTALVGRKLRATFTCRASPSAQVSAIIWQSFHEFHERIFGSDWVEVGSSSNATWFDVVLELVMPPITRLPRDESGGGIGVGLDIKPQSVAPWLGVKRGRLEIEV